MTQSTNPTVQMFNNYVLVRIDEGDEKTKDGLYMPPSKGERTEAVALKAVVVAVPESIKIVRLNMDTRKNEQTGEVGQVPCKVGDTIFCSKWEVHAVRIGTEKFATVRATDVMFKLG